MYMYVCICVRVYVSMCVYNIYCVCVYEYVCMLCISKDIFQHILKLPRKTVQIFNLSQYTVLE